MVDYNFHGHKQSETEKKQNKKEWINQSDQTSLSPKEKFYSGLIFIVIVVTLVLLILGESNNWW